jgi:DNA (cytosine-5)-methyltransferase 1
VATGGNVNRSGARSDELLLSGMARQAARTGVMSDHLLPTPVVNNMGAGKTPKEWAALKEKWHTKLDNGRFRNGNGHGNSLAIEVQLLPTPTTQDGANNGGDSQFQRNSLPLNAEVMLLPTPTSQAAKHGSTPDHGANAFGHNLWDLPHLLPTPLNAEVMLLPTPAASDGMRGPDYARVGREQSGGDDLVTTMAKMANVSDSSHLLPTPRAMTGGGDNTAGKDRPSGHKGTTNLHGLLQDPATDWGKYGSAIARWAEVIGRPAPEPTVDGKLNPALVEWMMGYPQDWTVDMSRTAALKALGNAIVPHQAAAAWGHLL